MANEVRIKVSGESKDAEAALAAVGKDVDVLKKKSEGIGEAFARNRQKIGLALTGMGAAITGFAGLAVKSAFEEKQGIDRLSAAIAKSSAGSIEWQSAMKSSGEAIQKLVELQEKLITEVKQEEETIKKARVTIEDATFARLAATKKLVELEVAGKKGTLEFMKAKRDLAEIDQTIADNDALIVNREGNLKDIRDSLNRVTERLVDAQVRQTTAQKNLTEATQKASPSYKEMKAEIEGVISALQSKTNFGDGPQRDALTTLTQLTGDYKVALDALPVALDLATALNMDLNSASQLLAKALTGNTSVLTRYGVTLQEGATSTEVLAALTKQFGGSAEAAATPMSQLKNTLGDLMEVIGTQLIPIVTKGAQIVGSITQKLMAWAEAHPQLAKVMTIIIVALGGLMAVVGPLLLALPFLAAGFGILTGIMFGVILPILPLIVAIGALTAAAILLWKNWDTIWNGIKNITGEVVDFLQNSPFRFLLLFLGPAGLIILATAALAKHWDDIWHAIQATIETVWAAIQAVVQASIATLMATIQPFLSAWDKISGIAGAAGGVVGGVAGKVKGLFGFQHGGSFTVGGRGGTDSQLVAFRATPGERVAVTPPGRAIAGASGGVTVVVQGPIYGFDDFERRVGQAVRNIHLRGGGV